MNLMPSIKNKFRTEFESEFEKCTLKPKTVLEILALLLDPVIQTLKSALDPPLYRTYVAEDNKLKILAVEVLTYVQDPSAIWSEK